RTRQCTRHQLIPARKQVRQLNRTKITRVEQSEGGAGNPAIIGTEFLRSIVESHNVRRNGNSVKMESGLKAQQELEKIEQQIERLQALEGQNEETRRQVQQLHDRVNDLRREVSSHLNPW